MKKGSYSLNSNVIPAPGARVSDRPFRLLCREYGAGPAASRMLLRRLRRLYEIYGEVPGTRIARKHTGRYVGRTLDSSGVQALTNVAWRRANPVRVSRQCLAPGDYAEAE